MEKLRYTFPIYLLICFYFFIVSSTRTSKKIYYSIDGNSACFRRLNATHQIGCTSDVNGNVGIVHHVTTEDDFDWVINKGPHQLYAVLLGPEDFNFTNVQRLRHSGRVNGIMIVHVLENETLTPFPEEGFSPDKACPNDQYGLYHGNSNYSDCQQVKWNSAGNNLMFQDFSFPIFILTNQTEADFLINDCYEKFNRPTLDGTAREYPLCAVELKDRMSGAKDSPTCIRRTNVPTNLNPDTYCDPLGDKNVAATIKEVANNETYPEGSVIVAAARMDSFSLFENVYPSADNHVTGIVGLLAAAEALGKVKDIIKNKTESRDILFAFLQGEAFDYIGSSRMLYEMERGNFPAQNGKNKNIHTLHPVTIDHISHFVEVNQLGYRDKDGLWIHTDPLSRQMINISKEIDDMIESIKKISKDVGVDMDSINHSQPLPPASVQRFLKKKNIPSIVITDHEGPYTNKYYNSRFDVAKEINATTETSNDTDTSNVISQQARMLTNVSTTLARFLFNLSTGENPPAGLEADINSVNDMLNCFLVSRRCELFNQIIDPADSSALNKDSDPYPFYVSVDTVSNHVTDLTKRLLSLYLGDTVNVTNSGYCKQPAGNKIFQYIWMQGPQIKNLTKRQGMCIKSTANTSLAKSPAFDIEGYDWNSGQYSSWTESSWQSDSISVRIFLVPSDKMQTGVLSAGVILTLLSLLVVYGCNSKADIIFTRRTIY